MDSELPGPSGVKTSNSPQAAASASFRAGMLAPEEEQRLRASYEDKKFEQVQKVNVLQWTKGFALAVDAHRLPLEDFIRAVESRKARLLVEEAAVIAITSEVNQLACKLRIMDSANDARVSHLLSLTGEAKIYLDAVGEWARAAEQAANRSRASSDASCIQDVDGTHWQSTPTLPPRPPVGHESIVFRYSFVDPESLAGPTGEFLHGPVLPSGPPPQAPSTPDRAVDPQQPVLQQLQSQMQAQMPESGQPTTHSFVPLEPTAQRQNPPQPTAQQAPQIPAPNEPIARVQFSPQSAAQLLSQFAAQRQSAQQRPLQSFAQPLITPPTAPAQAQMDRQSPPQATGDREWPPNCTQAPLLQPNVLAGSTSQASSHRAQHPATPVQPQSQAPQDPLDFFNQPSGAQSQAYVSAPQQHLNSSFRNSFDHYSLGRKARQVPKFGGEIKKFREWEQLFRVFVDETPAPTIEKFNLLRSSLTGKAKDAISHLQWEESHYQIAKDILREKFGDSRLAQRSHIQEMDVLLSKGVISNSRLETFVESVALNIRALVALGVTFTELSTTTNQRILRCLPLDLREKFIVKLAEFKQINPLTTDLEFMLNFLEGTVKVRREAEWGVNTDEQRNERRQFQSGQSRELRYCNQRGASHHTARDNHSFFTQDQQRNAGPRPPRKPPRLAGAASAVVDIFFHLGVFRVVRFFTHVIVHVFALAIHLQPPITACRQHDGDLGIFGCRRRCRAALGRGG